MANGPKEKPAPSEHSFYTITGSAPFNFRGRRQELTSNTVLGTIWNDFKGVVCNVFSGCCSGRDEELIPEIRASLRGTAMDPRYYSPKDRGTYAEVTSWMGSVSNSFHTWSLPRTWSTEFSF